LAGGVAKLAIKTGVGGAGVALDFEKILLDTMLSLPEQTGLTQVVIDKDVVNGKKQPRVDLR
jgi:ATP-dependent Clp protease ATP-binding subunit ClpX